MMDEELSNRLLRGVSDPRVREAFGRVDRRLFVPSERREEAWSDRPLPVEDGATISQPSLVARMTDWLEVGPEDQVLEIGTGTGYQTALLAELAARVATVEYSDFLSQSARARLEALGYNTVCFRVGDGRQGWPEEAPFDRIMATVAFPERPVTLLDQLSPRGGVAVVPVGGPREAQRLIRYRRDGEDLTTEPLLAVRFLSLR